MIVGLCGDWHGNAPWATKVIASIGSRGVTTILHAGDFGVWPGPSGKRYLMRIDQACEAAGVERILCCPGNHEDWGRLMSMWSLDKYRDQQTGDPLPLRLTEHVTVLPRGYAWEMDGIRIVSLGGAPSVDRDRRRRGKDWWPEEAIEPEDVARTIRNGAGADVMLTHDCPEAPYMVPEVEAIVHGGAGEIKWPEDALAYAAVGRERLTEAFLGVKPRLLAHGHYHAAGETTVQIPGADHETRIWALDCDLSMGNLRLLDLATLTDAEWDR